MYLITLPLRVADYHFERTTTTDPTNGTVSGYIDVGNGDYPYKEQGTNLVITATNTHLIGTFTSMGLTIKVGIMNSTEIETLRIENRALLNELADDNVALRTELYALRKRHSDEYNILEAPGLRATTKYLETKYQRAVSKLEVLEAQNCEIRAENEALRAAFKYLREEFAGLSASLNDVDDIPVV